jgi:hypothetical protein
MTSFDQGNVSFRTQHWRYLRYADGSEELYDHRKDPREWKNLAADPASAPVLTELRRQADPGS